MAVADGDRNRSHQSQAKALHLRQHRPARRLTPASLPWVIASPACRLRGHGPRFRSQSAGRYWRGPRPLRMPHLSTFGSTARLRGLRPAPCDCSRKQEAARLEDFARLEDTVHRSPRTRSRRRRRGPHASCLCQAPQPRPYGGFHCGSYWGQARRRRTCRAPAQRRRESTAEEESG